MAIVVSPACDPLRGRIKMPDPHVDALTDPVSRQGVPPRCPDRNDSVDLEKHVGISDQSGTEHRDCDHLEIHVTAGKGRTEFRQPFQEFHPVVHLRGGPAPADTQLSRDLGSHRLPVVDAPIQPSHVIQTGHPHLTQPSGRQQPPGHRRPLGPLGVGHLRKECGLIR